MSIVDWLIGKKKKQTAAPPKQNQPRVLDIDHLSSQLRDKDADTRWRAAKNLSAVNDVNSVNTLMKAVLEPNPDIRADILEGVSAEGDFGRLLKELRPKLGEEEKDCLAVGWLLFPLGQSYDEMCEKEVKKAIAKAENNALNHCLLGLLYLRRSSNNPNFDSGKAREEFDKSIAIDPHLADAYYGISALPDLPIEERRENYVKALKLDVHMARAFGFNHWVMAMKAAEARERGTSADAFTRAMLVNPQKFMEGMTHVRPSGQAAGGMALVWWNSAKEGIGLYANPADKKRLWKQNAEGRVSALEGKIAEAERLAEEKRQAEAARKTTSRPQQIAMGTPPLVVTNSKDGSELIYIPAGEFLMGSPSGEGESDEHPQHKVYLDAYYIGKYEVTNKQFAKFVQESGYQAEGDWKNYHTFGKGNHPVVGVSWNDAKAYCKWADLRLPTEAEWENAARGTDGRKYPWGNEWDASKCNNNSSKGTKLVGSYSNGASPYGCLDMSGNVWEWCSDWYGADYYASSPQRNPEGPGSGNDHILRGGSWFYDLTDNLRCAYRLRYFPDYWSIDYGFRLCRSANTR